MNDLFDKTSGKFFFALIFAVYLKVNNMQEFKIIAIMPERRGVSQNGAEWRSKDIVLESTADVQYRDSIVASLTGDRIDRYQVEVGQGVKAGLSFFAHNKDGRWFNNIRIYNIEH